MLKKCFIKPHKDRRMALKLRTVQIIYILSCKRQIYSKLFNIFLHNVETLSNIRQIFKLLQRPGKRLDELEKNRCSLSPVLCSVYFYFAFNWRRKTSRWKKITKLETFTSCQRLFTCLIHFQCKKPFICSLSSLTMLKLQTLVC